MFALSCASIVRITGGVEVGSGWSPGCLQCEYSMRRYVTADIICRLLFIDQLNATSKYIYI
jgi:hypothetical protein